MRRSFQSTTGFGMSTESSYCSASNRDVPREPQAETNSDSGQDFDVMEAVSLFYSRLDAALDKKKYFQKYKIN